MSETPRTDAETKVIGSMGATCEFVNAKFSRQLETELAAKERELAEARELTASETAWADEYHSRWCEAERERNAARSAIRGAMEFTDIIEKWLDQNGHGPNAPVKYHSNCFACGLVKKGAELRTQLRSAMLSDAINKPARAPGEGRE